MLYDPNEGDDSSYDSYGYDSDMSQRTEGEDLTPAAKIDLWKKLQDLMRN